MSARTRWWEQTGVYAFDLETTGVSPHEDRIVTAALVKHRPGRNPIVSTWLADPGVDIPDEAAAVHGITTEYARQDGAPVADVVAEVVDQLLVAIEHEIPIVVANAPFDLTMLEAEARRHDVRSLTAGSPLANGAIAPVIDPQVLEKHADPYRKVKGGCRCGCGAEDKTLTGLTTHYRIELVAAHSADADAMAAALLWPVVMTRNARKFDGIDNVRDLHRAQVGWRREQADSLRAYFDKTGVDHDGICPEFPLHVQCRPGDVEKSA